MKRYIIFIVIVILCPINLVYSQDFRFGAKVGGNLSWLGDTNGSSTSRVGYLVGVVGSWEFEQIGLQWEIDFSTQGGKIDFPNFSYEEQYNYINLPVILKFPIGQGFNIQFGTYFGILLSATQKETIGSDEAVNNIDEFIANTDYGFLAGVGYDLTNGLNFEIRYNYGMTDVDSKANSDRRNRFIQISVAYFFIR